MTNERKVDRSSRTIRRTAWSGLAVACLLAASGCATRGYVRDEIAGLEARQAESHEQMLQNTRSAHAEASQAASDAEAASRDASRAGDLALGDVSFRETRRYVVTFDFDSAELSRSAQATLNEAAAEVSAERRVLVDIQGHTDTTGDAAYNDWLSTVRAENVRRYLALASGTPIARLGGIGMGEAEPLKKGSEEDHEGSRRVVVRLLERTPPDAPGKISAAAGGREEGGTR
jgi:peptidoglycan-associated lipoprotein